MKKSFKNIFFGVGGQIITILIGLMLPRLRIISFGSEVNGMLSSVQQIFAYMTLLEAGIGTAALQALYGPIAKDDKKSTNEILAAANQYYKRTGLIYLAALAIFAIVYPLVVKSNIPTSTIVLVILLNGFGNVLAYFFQAKYTVMLQAEGKQYISTNLTTFVTVFSGIAKIALLYMGFDVISLQVAYFMFNLLKVVYFAYYIKKNYKWIDLKVKPNVEALSQKNSVLVHQVSQMIFNNTDVLILTLFCDLKLVSVYVVYNMVFEMISVLINNINLGFLFKLGQLFNTDKKKFLSFYDIYERYYTALSFALYTVAFLLVTPFIKLYTAKVEDINYVIVGLPALFTAIKLMVSGRGPSGNLATFAQHFKETQWRSVAEMIINIVVSLICVQFWGIYGVLIGTVVSLLYRANDMIIYGNRKVLNASPWRTYKWWLLDIAIFGVIVLIYNTLNINIESLPAFFLAGAITTAISLALYILITYGLSYKKTKEFLREYNLPKLFRRRGNR